MLGFIVGTACLIGLIKVIRGRRWHRGHGYGCGYRGGFEAHTRINRQDFGVAWNDVIEGGGAVLGDDVDITINVEAAKEMPKPAPSPAPKKGR